MTPEAVRRTTWYVVVILLLGAAARLYHIQTQGIWFDEGWSAYAATRPTLAEAVQADPTNPPLYYLLLNIAVRGFGDTPFALRWFSGLWGLVAVALAYQLGRRLFHVRAGAYAALLTAVSPLLWWAAQEARMYTLLAVLVLMAALGWQQLIRRPTRWAWLAVLGAELSLLYAHNTGPVAVLWLNLAALLAWASRRSLQRPNWFAWIGGQAVVAVLWSPWFVTRFVLLQEANSAVYRPPQLGSGLLSQMWQALWAGSWAMVGQESILVVLSVLLMPLALLLIPWHSVEARWLVAHVLVLTGGLLVGLGVLGNEMHGRYLVMVAPLLLVTLGEGLARLPVRSLRYLVTSLFLVTLLVSIYFIYFAAQKMKYQHDDARGMAQYYADTLGAEDAVLAWSYADRYDLAYYWERLGVRARRIILPEGADLDAMLPLLPERGDVALNVWWTQRADYRGMMSCLLENGSVNSPQEFTANGMRSYLYQASALQQLELAGMDIAFLSVGTPLARLTRVGRFPRFSAAQALCLPLELTLEQNIDVDLKAALIVENPLGWEIASSDAIFADAAQRLTGQLAPGAALTAYPLLRLPYGTPAGDYRVVLRVYDEAVAPWGYDAQSQGEVSNGKPVALGLWSVSQADWAQAQRDVGLPTGVNLPFGDDLTLVAHSASLDQPITLRNGDSIRLSLLWEGEGALPDLTLRAEGGDWSVVFPATIGSSHSTITLDWREGRVPVDAQVGTSELVLPDGTVLARYRIETLAAEYEPPTFDVPVGVVFPELGELVGYTLESDDIDRSEDVPVTLVWRSGETPPEANYTVFVQLLDARGIVIAQSDAFPAQGNRPTTGWRPGEYIVDHHELHFHEGVTPGMATLIAGLYDARDGQRVTTSEGENAILLNDAVEVH